MDNINYTNLKRISADIKQITIELKTLEAQKSIHRKKVKNKTKRKRKRKQKSGSLSSKYRVSEMVKV